MNPNWVEKLFRKFNVEYRHRWVIYDEILSNYITEATVWLDIGCGKNEYIADLGHKAKTALGIDMLNNQDRVNASFLQANLLSIPLPSGYANLITMRLIVEHLENIPEDFSEICRLLRPGGHLILLTPNSLSPVVFLPRLLPYRLKSWLIQKIFSVRSDEVFKTYHRFNTPMKITKGLDKMSLLRLEFIEQVPLNNVLLTLIFGLWYSIVKLSPLRYFRSNLIAVFEKLPI